MFIFVAYSASILMLLRSQADIRSVSDLLEYKFDVGSINRTFARQFFLGLKDGIFKEVYDRKIRPNNYFELPEGFEKIRTEHFAYLATEAHSSLFNMQKFTNYDVCAYKMIPSFVTEKSYIPVPKNSGYFEVIKIGLLVMHERGIVERAKFRTVRKPICNNNVGNFASIHINDCVYVIYIFFYGTFLSLLILLVENIYKRYLENYILSWTKKAQKHIVDYILINKK
ncbi:uncharacterized protein LOC143193679 [Rhynchophorus ferrugineus]|uniref:uncharacterized protein LOC143193679 n=1 Tax=Rhynchophorus ferrugineus TaxID=354439 RepID=UPI003FCDBF1B